VVGGGGGGGGGGTSAEGTTLYVNLSKHTGLTLNQVGYINLCCHAARRHL
jgi:hypothetical protein